ncbi:UDP-glucose 4-epimerase [Candidatus Terasakiella magnetica]|nr:UDP-glucose 4-epimerase [Candidatus Terasakiella magnetica]
MTSPKVLVTGGAGYVGSHTCKALAAAGFLPISLDNLTRGHRHAVRWGPLEQGDVRDGDFLKAVLAAHRPAAVLHFAALAYPAESVTRPDLYFDNNVVGTLTLLQALHAAGISRMIASSSCAVYGAAPTLPVSEDTPCLPITAYGASKLMMEQMQAEFSRAFGLRRFALRYFNAAGADPSGELGEDHDPELHLIPNALRVACGLRPHLDVHGEDYPTPDGTCIRDYLHVSDLADAHVAAMKALLDGSPGGVLNLGTGTGHSVRQVAAIVSTITGRPVPLRVGPRRPGDPPALVADATRAARIGIAYPRSDMPTMIATAWAWMTRRQD